jgi:hypothetical protein
MVKTFERAGQVVDHCIAGVDYVLDLATAQNPIDMAAQSRSYRVQAVAAQIEARLWDTMYEFANKGRND